MRTHDVPEADSLTDLTAISGTLFVFVGGPGILFFFRRVSRSRVGPTFEAKFIHLGVMKTSFHMETNTQKQYFAEVGVS